MTSKARECVRCIHWTRIQRSKQNCDSLFGYCRRFPPTIVSELIRAASCPTCMAEYDLHGTDGLLCEASHWPMTGMWSCCGEFYEKDT